MKKKTQLFAFLGFAAGIMAGVAMIGLLAFTQGPRNPGITGDPHPISATAANAQVRNHIRTAEPLNKVVKGFTVDRAQLDAMNMILGENPELAGFRIYLGKDSTGAKTAIVVGVDTKGIDAMGTTFYSTEASSASPCPPLCDNDSPILRETGD